MVIFQLTYLHGTPMVYLAPYVPNPHWLIKLYLHLIPVTGQLPWPCNELDSAMLLEN